MLVDVKSLSPAVQACYSGLDKELVGCLYLHSQASAVGVSDDAICLDPQADIIHKSLQCLTEQLSVVFVRAYRDPVVHAGQGQGCYCSSIWKAEGRQTPLQSPL